MNDQDLISEALEFEDQVASVSDFPNVDSILTDAPFEHPNIDDVASGDPNTATDAPNEDRNREAGAPNEDLLAEADAPNENPLSEADIPIENPHIIFDVSGEDPAIVFDVIDEVPTIVFEIPDDDQNIVPVFDVSDDEPNPVAGVSASGSGNKPSTSRKHAGNQPPKAEKPSHMEFTTDQLELHLLKRKMIFETERFMMQMKVEAQRLQALQRQQTAYEAQERYWQNKRLKEMLDTPTFQQPKRYKK